MKKHPLPFTKTKLVVSAASKRGLTPQICAKERNFIPLEDPKRCFPKMCASQFNVNLVYDRFPNKKNPKG